MESKLLFHLRILIFYWIAKDLLLLQIKYSAEGVTIREYQQLLKDNFSGDITITTCAHLENLVKQVQENFDLYLPDSFVYQLRLIPIYCKELRVGISPDKYMRDKKILLLQVVRLLTSSDSLWELIDIADKYTTSLRLDCEQYINQSQYEDAKALQHLSNSFASEYSYIGKPDTFSNRYKWLNSQTETRYRINLTPIVLKCIRDGGDCLSPPFLPYFAKEDKPKVYIKIVLQTLLELTNEGDLRMLAFFNFTWRDPRRIWASNGKYPFPKQALLPSDEIWHPKLQILKCIAESCYVQPDEESYITLHSNGYAHYGVWKHVKTRCRTRLDVFPFDTQWCEAEFLPATPFRILMITEPIRATHFDSEEWQLLRFKATDGFYTYYNQKINSRSGMQLLAQSYLEYSIQMDSVLLEEFAATSRSEKTLKIVMQLARNTHHYVFTLIIPALILNIIGIGSTFIPVDTTGKIKSLLTVMLTFVLLQGVIAEQMPHSTMWPIVGGHFVFSLIATSFYFCTCCLQKLVIDMNFDAAHPALLERTATQEEDKFLVNRGISGSGQKAWWKLPRSKLRACLKFLKIYKTRVSLGIGAVYTLFILISFLGTAILLMHNINSESQFANEFE